MEDSFSTGGGFHPFNDNPQAGIRRDASEFGGSKMFIPGGFQTMPSKANDMHWDDEDETGGPAKPSFGSEEDTPF